MVVNIKPINNIGIDSILLTSQLETVSEFVGDVSGFLFLLDFEDSVDS